MKSKLVTVSDLKRYDLTGTDGWPSKVNRVGRTEDGVTKYIWSLADGRRLEPSADGRYLTLPGSDMMFVLPDDDD